MLTAYVKKATITLL